MTLTFELAPEVARSLTAKSVLRGMALPDYLRDLAERDAPRASLRDTFSSLVAQWQSATTTSSSVAHMSMHPAYQRIIGLGAAAVPLLLEELRDRPDHWFWALHAITGEDPAQGLTDFDAAVAAWLDWGRDRGFLS